MQLVRARINNRVRYRGAIKLFTFPAKRTSKRFKLVLITERMEVWSPTLMSSCK